MSNIVMESWTLEEGTRKVTELFEHAYGYSPEALHSAPGRVNVIGEHTDYNGGFALPMALPHRTYAAVSQRDDRIVRLVSAQEEGVREVNLDEVDTHDSKNPVEGWPAYVVGVAWALEQQGGVRCPVSISQSILACRLEPAFHLLRRLNARLPLPGMRSWHRLKTGFR